MSTLEVGKIVPATGTAITLGDSGDTFTIPASATLDVNGTIDVAGATKTGFPGLFSGYAIFADQKSAGTAGGTATSGDWRQRDINTTLANTDTTNISLGTNLFTLQAGNYWVQVGCTYYSCQEARTRLYDTTGTATVGVSNTQHASSSSAWTQISVRVTPSVATTYRVDYRVQLTKATDGLGDVQSWGEVEQFLVCNIFKEA
jgi:hypothetical protein